METFYNITYDLHPIYFDHKLADRVSTYTFTYLIGCDIFDNWNKKSFDSIEFKYEPMSLISICDVNIITKAYKDKYNDGNICKKNKIFGVIYDLKDLNIKPESTCPFPFYKTINYIDTYNVFSVKSRSKSKSRSRSKSKSKSRK